MNHIVLLVHLLPIGVIRTWMNYRLRTTPSLGWYFLLSNKCILFFTSSLLWYPRNRWFYFFSSYILVTKSCVNIYVLKHLIFTNFPSECPWTFIIYPPPPKSLPFGGGGGGACPLFQILRAPTMDHPVSYTHIYLYWHLHALQLALEHLTFVKVPIFERWFTDNVGVQ